jgi:leucyl aminopeptidase
MKFLFVCLVLVVFVAAIELPPSPGMRLIQIEGARKWMTEEQADRLARSKEARFMDVTDTQDLDTDFSPIDNTVYPDQPNQRDLMIKLLPQVSKLNLTDKITHLSTAFMSRHCTHADGLRAAQWIKKKYEDIISTLNPERRALFEVKLVPTPSRPQPSVVAVMKGSSQNEDIVILGAHEDSITHRRTQREPGADDDASGTATVMEVFRVVAQSTTIFKRNLEFHHVIDS